MWPFTKLTLALKRLRDDINQQSVMTRNEHRRWRNDITEQLTELGDILQKQNSVEVDPLATLRTVEGREVTKIVAIATQAWRDQSEAYKQELNTTTTELGKVNDKLAAAERLLKVAERQVTQRDDQLEAFKARMRQQSRMLEVMAHMDLNLYQQAREQISQEPEHRSDFVEKVEEKLEEKIATLHP